MFQRTLWPMPWPLALLGFATRAPGNHRSGFWTNQVWHKPKTMKSHLTSFWLRSARSDSTAASHNQLALRFVRIAIIHKTNDRQLSLSRDEWKVSSPSQPLQPWALSRAHSVGSSPCYCMATPPQLCKDVIHQQSFRALEDTTSLFGHTAYL